ncbi:unnamed protein product [Nezara viridula]|uniref:Uncharacterized protein n=1 Tax=Nezara viridula TaxID=85310 RepID=A0A9P0E7S1_NEZVI|nr:unnamed protein product [Nezara viridula]
MAYGEDEKFVADISSMISVIPYRIALMISSTSVPANRQEYSRQPASANSSRTMAPLSRHLMSYCPALICTPRPSGPAIRFAPRPIAR